MIRLRGRWELLRGNACTQSSNDELNFCDAPIEYFTLPFSWPPATAVRGDAERVTLRRAFHRPTGLTPSSRVTLAVEHVGINAAISINDSHLGELGEKSRHARWDVTDVMNDYNQIVLVMQPADCTLQSVNLEITEA